METLFYVIRHGQSVGNVLHVCQGQVDLDLSERGYMQAEFLADAMKYLHFDAIYSSDLKRAYNTALPHARLRGLPVISDKNLREIDLGEYGGRHIDVLKDAFENTLGVFRAPGGESFQEMQKRLSDEVFRIAEERPGQQILLVSHALAIRSLYTFAFGIAPLDVAKKSGSIPNATFCLLKVEDGGLSVLKYGEKINDDMSVTSADLLP